MRYITTFRDLTGSIEIKELIKRRAQKDTKQKIRILLFNISNVFFNFLCSSKNIKIKDKRNRQPNVIGLCKRPTKDKVIKKIERLDILPITKFLIT